MGTTLLSKPALGNVCGPSRGVNADQTVKRLDCVRLARLRQSHARGRVKHPFGTGNVDQNAPVIVSALAAQPKESAQGSVKTTSGMENAGQSVMFQSALAAHLKESAQGSVKTTSGMENAGQSAMFQSVLAAHLKESALGSVKTTSGMENAGQNAMFQSVLLASLRHLVPVTLVYKRLTTTFATWSAQTTPVVTRNATVRNQQPHHQRDICLQGQRSTAITSLQQKPPPIFPQHLRILNVVPFVMAKPRVHLDWALLSLTFHSIALKISYCLIKEQIDIFYTTKCKSKALKRQDQKLYILTYVVLYL